MIMSSVPSSMIDCIPDFIEQKDIGLAHTQGHLYMQRAERDPGTSGPDLAFGESYASTTARIQWN